MGQRRPLSDAWLFWDAERLESYPHSGSTGADARQPAQGPISETPGKPLRLRLLEDLLLYFAGVASAMVGVGLALLLGSFISAYSVLTDVKPASDESIVDYPALNLDKLVLLADAATAAGNDTHVTMPSAQASRVVDAPAGTAKTEAVRSPIRR